MNKPFHYMSFWLGLFLVGWAAAPLLKGEDLGYETLFFLLLAFFNVVIAFLSAILDNQKLLKQTLGGINK